MRVMVELPKYLPESTDPRVVEEGQPGGWDRHQEPSDYEDVIARWRSQDASSKSIFHASIGLVDSIDVEAEE